MCSPAPTALAPEEDAEDPFDRLPIALLLPLFNALRDVKSLGRCCAVSRRFCLLALQADSVLVRVDCVVSSSSSSSLPPAHSPSPRQHDAAAAANGDGGAPKYGGILGAFARLLFATFVSRPLHALHQVLLPRRVLLAAEISHHSPAEVLRGFGEVRSLQIMLPSGELGVDPGAVLRWTAAFGHSLQSCTILGATSFRRRQSCPAAAASSTDSNNADDDEDDQSFCTNGGLKLQVLWTITSLIPKLAHSPLPLPTSCVSGGQGKLPPSPVPPLHASPSPCSRPSLSTLHSLSHALS